MLQTTSMLQCPPRRAFTLAEAIISMSILVVLVGGLASAVVLSTRVLPSVSVQRDTAARVGNAAAQIAEEMRTALWFIERTATQVTFTVPDRNNDGVPERIRYSWSGIAGASLFREINGGGAVVFVSAVDGFAIDYRTTTETETFVGAPVESSETSLRSYRASAASNALVQTTAWWGEYFRPTLPADAITWKVTRAAFYACSHSSSSGVNSVELRPADALYLPTSIVLAQQTMLESNLSGSFSRQTFSFSGVQGLAPSAGLCLVVLGTSGSGTTAQLEYQGSGVALPNAGLLAYKSGAWTMTPTQALSFEIFGTYTQPGPNQSMVRTYISDVTVALTSAGEPALAVASTVNRPEALLAVWSTDFTADPALDANGDGTPDWESRSGAINLALRIADSWTGTQRLYSMPNCSFLRPTRSRVRFRAAAVAGSAAVFSQPFAWTGGTTAGIVASLARQSDATQTLTVSTKTGDSTLRTLATVTGLGDRTVELGLRLNPTLQTVNIETDGRSRGTFTYDRYTPVTDTPNATIVGTGGGGVFESVSIRVDE